MTLQLPQPVEANPHNPATAWAFKTMPDFRLTDLTATEAWEFVKTGRYLASRPDYWCMNDLVYGMYKGRLTANAKYYWHTPANLSWFPYRRPFFNIEALNASDWYVIRVPAPDKEITVKTSFWLWLKNKLLLH